MLAEVTEYDIRLVPTGRTLRERPPLGGPQAVYRVCKRHRLHISPVERLIVIFLDSQNNRTGWTEVSRGALNTVRTLPREIFRPAILAGAASLVLAHNHPSGCLDPSPEDLDFTRTISRAGDLVGIEVHDHLIVTTGGYTSLRERGLM
jgi:DNA repair protein RadC